MLKLLKRRLRIILNTNNLNNKLHNNTQINSIDNCKTPENDNKNPPKIKIKNIDEVLLLDLSEEDIHQFVEEKLKYNPKSDFIYNKAIPTDDELSRFSKEQVIKYFKDLASDHYQVCKENEQFRTQNFKQYIQLRKLEALGDS